MAKKEVKKPKKKEVGKAKSTKKKEVESTNIEDEKSVIETDVNNSQFETPSDDFNIENDPILNEEVQEKEYAKVSVKGADPDNFVIPEHKVAASSFDIDKLKDIRTPQDEIIEEEESPKSKTKKTKAAKKPKDDFGSFDDIPSIEDIEDEGEDMSAKGKSDDFSEFRSESGTASRKGAEDLVEVVIFAYKQLHTLAAQKMALTDADLSKLAQNGQLDLRVLSLPIQVGEGGADQVSTITVQEFIDTYNNNVSEILTLSPEVEAQIRSTLTDIFQEQGYEVSPIVSLAMTVGMDIVMKGISIYALNKNVKVVLANVSDQFAQQQAQSIPPPPVQTVTDSEKE
jgi:hypothetical protein